VRHIGVSNFDADQLRRAQQIAPVETLQAHYSLIERDIERAILPYTCEQRIGVIAYSPMGSGMLTGAMTRERATSCLRRSLSGSVRSSASAAPTRSTPFSPLPTSNSVTRAQPKSKGAPYEP
jgi:aryl-alcohol dehydrogenase-like predicted oxidoreductase